MNLKEVQNYSEEKRKKIFVVILSIITIIFMIIWILDVGKRVSNVNIEGEFSYDVDKFNTKIEKTKERIQDASEEFKKEIEIKQKESIEEEKKAKAELDAFINTSSSINYAQEE